MKEKPTKTKFWFPLILSIFIPGLGQLIKGHWKKGLLLITIFMFPPFLGHILVIILMMLAEYVNNLSIMLFIGYAIWVGIESIYLLQLVDAVVSPIKTKSYKKTDSSKNGK